MIKGSGPDPRFTSINIYISTFNIVLVDNNRKKYGQSLKFVLSTNPIIYALKMIA